MTLTLAVYLAIGCLLVAALARRPQGLTLTIAVSFLCAIAAAQVAHGDHIKPIALALDALTVVSAWFLWDKHQSTRASLVAWLGLCKILFGIASADWPYLAWAIGNNVLFVVMVLVAGGFTDGIIAWLGRRGSGAEPRGSGVLRYLARFE